MVAESRSIDTSPAPWRIVAERKIQEWLDAGGAARLPRGKPIDLSENPYLKAEYRMAFKVLENAGMAPEWILLGRDVEEALAALRELARRFHADVRAHRLQLRSSNPAGFRAIEDMIERRTVAFRTEFLEAASAANRLIDRFNICVPVMYLGRVRLDPSRELERALRAR